ncbi:MAG: flagellar protein FlaG [Nitrospinota bacterium]|nr:flagellar protein FlaG [Nitrospinota bacterium]MEC9423271.1 flagellar protein FlaG [Nitrospinota bacterium]
MSLTISSNPFSVGYGPQLNSRVPKPQDVADPSQVKLLGNKDEDSVELLGNKDEDSVELTTLKTVSDENDISADNHGLSDPGNKTRIRIDPETQEVIIEVVDGKTGEEVRQIPGEQQLRLNKGISAYNDILSKRVDNIDFNGVDDLNYKQPESEK